MDQASPSPWPTSTSRRSSATATSTYSKYRTSLTWTAKKGNVGRQETDTISRMVYGFASAYLLTGEDRYLEAAEKGTEYLREHMRFDEKSEDIFYWYHAVDRKPDGTQQKIFASEFGDDYRRHPRLRADLRPRRADPDLPDHRRPAHPERAEGTINLFDRFFLDKTEQGRLLLPHRSDSCEPAHRIARPQPGQQELELGRRPRAGLPDQPVAGDRRDPSTPAFLEYTFDTIVKHFPDYEQQSRSSRRAFTRTGAHDQRLGLAAEPGGRRPQPEDRLEPDAHVPPASPRRPYVALARKIAELMPQRGHGPAARRLVRRRRARAAKPDEKSPSLRLARSQGVVAAGAGHPGVPHPGGVTVGDAEYLRLARESSAFYNAWFLDTRLAAASTSTCWPTAFRTCWAPSAARAATR